MRDRFQIQLDLKSQTEIATIAATTISEGFFIGVLQDDTLDRPRKKQKLEKEMSQLTVQTRMYRTDMQARIHGAVLTAATNFLVG